MASKLEMLLELERRGELPEEAAAMLGELRKRDALPGSLMTPPSARQRAEKVLGVNPTLEARNPLLPLAREPRRDPNRPASVSDLNSLMTGPSLESNRGDLVVAWPKIATSGMETAARPRAILEGSGFTAGDALQDTLNILGGAGTFTRSGTAPVTRAEAITGNRTMRAMPQEEIKAAAQSAYQAADKSGVAFSKDAYHGLLRDVFGWVGKTKTNRKQHPGVMSGIEEMSRGFFRKKTDKSGNIKYKDVSADGGRDVGFQEMMAIRKLFADEAAGLNSVGKPTPQAQRAQQMVDRIDRFVDDIGTDGLAKGTAKSKQDALKNLQAARLNWSRYMKVAELERIMDRASRAGAGVEAGLRNEIRALLNNEKRSRWYSAEEKRQLERALHGTTLTRFNRILGRTAIGGEGSNIIGGSIGAGVGYGLFEMLGLPGAAGAVTVPTAGILAKGAARRATEKEAARAAAMAAQGPKYPNPGGRAAEILRLLSEARRAAPPAVGTVLPPPTGLPKDTPFKKWA